MIPRLQAVCVALAITSASPAFAQSPSDLVRTFYSGQHYETDPAIRDSHYTGKAKEMLEKSDAVSVAEEGPGCVDFSLAFDGQDYDQKEAAETLTLEETIDGNAAQVVARLKVFGEPREIVWEMAMTPDGWRIADVASRLTGWRLSELDCEIR